ncbi:DUF2237 family protein [Alteromonas flava]|uniref:DUF2237 family protein n=1 Tax=Alteromonas flava TaxID=2048003 RepID=UPI000C29355E|nr:DUF2237 domain-containing protein [Alteromonas flava]
MANARNVLGKPLQLCCGNTGFTREGFCYVPDSDFGNHSVCAVMTDEFLQFSLQRGNDLLTPNPQYSFPGLKAGDKWCLCASRWLEAESAGVAPPVVLAAVNQKALDIIPLQTLRQYAHQA